MKSLLYKGFLPVIRKLLVITCVCNIQENIPLFCFSRSKKQFIWRGPLLLWPEGMDYLQWQKILKSVCWFLGSKNKKTSSNTRRKPRGGCRAKKCLKASMEAKKKRVIESMLFKKETPFISDMEKSLATVADVNKTTPVTKNLREILKQKRIRRTEKPLKVKAAQDLLKQIRNNPKQNKLNLITDGINCKKEQSEDVTIELITLLHKFLDRKNIPQMLEKAIPDRRDPKTVTYSAPTIILAALSIFLLRMQSGNKYDDKTTYKDQKYSKKNISKFINAPEGCTPTIKTIEDFLKTMKLEQVNNLMVHFFKDLVKSKFFSEHSEIKLGDFFLLAVDCVHSHTYDKPHHLDEDSNPDCPYCLERIYNKGTPQIKTKWMHITLVYTFVFLNHLKIPLYTYPIHAKQVKKFKTASDADHKQECELVALKVTLPIIRQFFPRMKIRLLLDGLYANRPAIQLAEQYGCKYAIVRKEASLSSLAKDCDGLAKLSNHQKDCTKKTVHKEDGWIITRIYEWFNNMDLSSDKDKSILTNVLRFSESRQKTNKKTGLTEIKRYKGEWLLSEKLSSRTCEIAARQARLRWEEEDLFNSQKNREFNYKHDYSRNPRSFIIWQALSFFAFGIFELFRFSKPVMQRISLSIGSKTTISRLALVEKLSGQLCERPTEEIFSAACMSKRIQFRYDFSPPRPKPKTKLKKNGKDRLKAA